MGDPFAAPPVRNYTNLRLSLRSSQQASHLIRVLPYTQNMILVFSDFVKGFD